MPRPAGVPEGERWWVRNEQLSAAAAAEGDVHSADAASSQACKQQGDGDREQKEPELTEPTLFGPIRKQRAGNCAYPSDSPFEYLSDVILANAHAADERPEGTVPVRYNYPRPGSLVPNIFSQRPARRVIHEQQSVLIQQYCEGLHWHNLVLFGPEKCAYYWEPLHGATLAGRDPIRTAFERAVSDGWTLCCIPLVLQADGHSCGDWAHWFRCRVLAYTAQWDEEDRGARGKGLGSRTFGEFLRGEIVDLRSLRHVDRRSGEQANRKFAAERRTELRKLLRTAARKGVARRNSPTLLRSHRAGCRPQSSSTLTKIWRAIQSSTRRFDAAKAAAQARNRRLGECRVSPQLGVSLVCMRATHDSAIAHKIG
jgi:hypothetical protein